MDHSNLTHNHATADGGIIYINGHNANISDSRLEYSYAGQSGGAVYISGRENTITKSNLTHNNATNGFGGSIYIKGSSNNVTYSLFEYCTSTTGGAIYINGTDAHVTHSNFTQNGINPQLGQRDDTVGGTIYIEGDGAVVSDDNFNRSTAYNGGIIYVAGDDAQILNSNFTMSSAYNNGGAIYVAGRNAVIDEGRFSLHNATNGGAIYVSGSDADITNSNFAQVNVQDGLGGAIYVGGNSVDIIHSRFNTTRALNGNGGAIYVKGNNSNISHSNFDMAIAVKQSSSDFGKGSMIYILGEETVIHNSTFTRYNATVAGGALYIQGNNSNITNSSFEYGESNKGGAIYIEGRNTLLKYSNLTHNHAITDGGCIYVNGKDTTIDHSNINLTYASGKGGSVYIFGENAKVIDSNLTYNNAVTGLGGSIYIEGKDANITGSLFQYCSSLNGGAIYVKGFNATIHNSTFTQNNVSSRHGNGGAIYVEGSKTTISWSDFTRANANHGGFVYIHGNNTEIEHSTFNMSYSYSEGGAIYIAGINASISSSSFSMHNATLGGAVFVNGENTNITHSDFELGHASSYAGGIYLGGVNTRVFNSTFDRNIAQDGGAMYNNGGTAIVAFSNFTNNVANGDNAHGGAIYWKGGSSNDIIISCYFENNIAANLASSSSVGYGGAIYWSEGSDASHGAQIKNSTFYNNYAARHGGAIDWYSSDNGIIDNCSFIENHAKHDGGALYAGHDNEFKGQNLTVKNCTFTRNYGEKGGAISLQFGKSHIVNCTLDSNRGTQGGTLYMVNPKSNGTDITNCTFINSTTYSGAGLNGNCIGGACFIDVPFITFYNCTFVNGTIVENKAGGAIYFGSNAYNSTVNMCNFTNNTHAGSGGAISIVAENITVKNSTFKLNTAKFEGGAIYILSSNVTVTNSSFDENEVFGWNVNYYGGGAIFIANEDNLVNDSTFKNNYAKYGGAVYVKQSNNQVNNSTFKNNDVRVNGGAIYWIGDNGVINKVNITESDAEKGGAIYISAENVNITDSSISGNLATNGAGIYYYNSMDVMVSGTNITNNNATKGSGIYAESSNYTLNSVRLLDNQAYADLFINKTIKMDTDGRYYVTAIFTGNDNLLNAIWNDDNSKAIEFTNVTYWDANGITTTDEVHGLSNAEAGINITVTRIKTRAPGDVVVTDENGVFKYYFEDDGDAEFKFSFTHYDDTYYTGIIGETSILATNVIIEVADIDFGENATVKVTLKDRDGNNLSANVTVKINTTSGVITVEVINGFGSLNNVSGLSAGLHNATVTFMGNETYLGSTNSTIFRVRTAVDISITKQANLTNTSVGALVKYEIIIHNTGGSTANNVIITDNLEKGLKFIESGSNATNQGSMEIINGVEVVTWNISTLSPGAKVLAWVIVNTTINGTFSNVATVSSTEGGTNSSNTTNVTVNPVVRLNITKSVNMSEVNVGDLVKFTINVTNNGPSNATGVTVTDVLNDAFNFNSTNIAKEYYSINGRKITWTIPSIQNNTSFIIELVVRVMTNGTFSNVASVNSTENKTTIDSNTTNVTINPVVNLTVIKEANVSEVHVGELVKFNITVTNHGPSNATDVNITDILDSRFGFVSTNATKDSYEKSGNTIVWHILKLENNTSYTVELIVRVLGNGTIENVASVNSTENTTKSENKTSVNATYLNNFTITKQANTTNVHVGELVRFNIAVTNCGPSNATGVNITDVLDSRFAYVSDNSTGHYNKATHTVIWNIGNMENNTSRVIELVVRVLGNGTIDNTVSVNSTENTTGTSNGTSVNSTYLANLTVVKQANVSDVHVGELVKFNITVTNHGPSNATNVNITDVLDSRFGFVSTNATSDSYTRSGHTIIWHVSKLENNTSYIVELVVRVLGEGIINNTVSVNSTENTTGTENKTGVNSTYLANLTVVKEVNVTNVSVGKLVKFTITVTNHGPSNATNVNVTDVLDSRFAYVSDNSTGRYYSGIHTVIWNIGDMNNNTSRVIELVVRVLGEGIINNTVSVNSTENTTGTENKTGVNATYLANLTVVKVANVTNVSVGELVKFTINVTNYGPSNATNVIITDVLDSRFGFVSTNATSDSYTKSGRTIIWNINKLENNTSYIVELVVRVLGEGIINNTVSVNSTENTTGTENKTGVNASNFVNLTVIKVPDVNETSVGGLINFTITVTNNGPTNATNVKITDDLISGWSFVDAGGNYTRIGAQKVVWTISKLASGNSTSVWLQVRALTNGTLGNVVSVNSTENTTNVYSNETNVTVSPVVNLTVVKVANVTNVSVGELVKFTINVTNHGPSNATHINITDVLDSRFGFVSTNATVDSYTKSGQTVIWHIDKLENNTSYVVELVVRVLGNGTIENNVSVNSTENTTGSENKTNINATYLANLTVTKEANVTNVHVGELVKYIINVTNHGPSNATNVNITDVLDSRLGFVSTNATSDSYTKSGQIIIWHIDKLENNTSYTVELIVRVLGNGTIENLVSVNSTENTTGSENGTSLNSTYLANLTVTKEANVTNVHVGELVKFKITVTNHGPSNATDVNITDVLDGKFAYVSTNATAGSYNRSGRTIIWHISKLENNTSYIVELIVRVLGEGIINNTVSVNSTENTTGTEDKTNVSATYLNNFTITKQANVTNVHVGELVKFTVTVANHGPSNATSVNVTDVLDNRFAYVSGGNYNISSRTVTWNIGDMENNTSRTLELIVRVLGTGTIENTVSVNSTENTTGTDNKTGVNSTYLANLTVIKEANLSDVHVGELVKYIINVTNHGPSNATNVNITDVLDSRLEFVSTNATEDLYTKSGQTIIWHIDKLENNTSYSVELIVRVLGIGTIENTVSVNSTENTTGSENKTSVNSTYLANLTVIKEANVTNVHVGELVKFNITVINHGPSNAADVNITDVLDSRLGFVSTNAASDSYTKSGQTIIWHINKLENNTSQVIELIVRVLGTGSIENTVSVNSTENTTGTSNTTSVNATNLVNLTVIKTSDINQTSVGGLINFTITVTNNGPTNATNVKITDVLIKEFELVDAGGNPEIIGTHKLVWTILHLNAGNSTSVWVQVRALTNGTLRNVAIANSTENTTDVKSNRTNITVRPDVNLTVVKSSNATGNVRVGDIVNFTITVTNNGRSNATNIQISDVLGEAFKWINATDNRRLDENRKITWTISKLANGTSVSVWVEVEVLTNGTLYNTAYANCSENTTDVPGIANVTVDPKVNLTIVKSSNAKLGDNVSVGELFNFTITVTNHGPSNATDILVTDILDDAFEFRQTNVTHERSGQKIIWKINKLTPGETVIINLLVKAVKNGYFTNVAVVNSTESENKTSETVAVIEPAVNLTVIKKANVTGNASAGDLVNFTISIKNNGPSRATNVNIEDILPSGMKYEYSSFGGRNTTLANGTEVVTWFITDIANGKTYNVWVVVKVLAHGTLTNVARANCSENTTGTTNKTDLNVTSTVDLTINKTVDRTSVEVGETVTYTITVKNIGLCNATGVKVTENLKGSVEITASNPSKGNYTDYIWNIGELNVNETATLTLTVKILEVETVENSVVVKSNENDTNLTNNNYTSDNVTAGEISTPIELETENITYEDDETITVRLPDGATGYVNITINGTEYPNQPINGGVVILPILNPAGGIYNVTVDYGGDGKYSANSTKGTFKVSPKTPTIRIEVVDIYYGEIELLNVTVNAPGFVNITVDKVGRITASLDHSIQTTELLGAVAGYDGKATWRLINLAVGDYPVSALYLGNENYTSVSTSDVFKVMPLKTTVTVKADDIYVGENAVIDVTLAPVQNGNVTVEVDGVKYLVNITAGKGQLIVPGLKAGLKQVKVSYEGNETYLPSDNATTFTVKKLTPPLNVDSYDIYVGDLEKVTVTVPDDATGTITITVDGKKYTSEIKNGKATFDIPDLKAGKYSIDATYSGDDKYLPTTGSDTFNVLKHKPDISVDSPDITVGDDGVVTVTLPDDATGTVIIEIDGKIYTAKVHDGKAVFKIPGLEAGSYSIRVWYSGDEKYLPTQTVGEMNVNALNKTVPVHHKSGLAKHATGNPILLLVLILSTIGLGQLRRFRK